MSNFQYEITEYIDIISESAKGQTKELNLISWSNREPKYDLRDWNHEDCKLGSG